MLLRTLRYALVLAMAHGAMDGGGAHAETRWFHELKFGVVAQDVPHLWSGFQLESGFAVNAELIWARQLQLFGGVVRPYTGVSIALVDGQAGRATSKAYAGGRWEYESPRGWFAGIGLGAAVHDGNIHATDPTRKALGSRVLFHIPIEFGIRMDGNRSLSIYFDHMSNGSLRRENEGLDTLGVRYGYRF